MAKEEEKVAMEQAQQAEPAAASTNRDKWLQNMRAKYPEIEDEDALYEASMNGYDAEHEANKRFRAETEAFDEAIRNSPELADVYAWIFEHKDDGKAAMAMRMLPPELKRYTWDESYGDEEYLADRQKRIDEEKAQSERDAKLQEMREQAFVEVCKEDDIKDPAAALEALRGIFENPCENLDQCKEQARAFLKMINYDSAVEAAEVRGRNEQIEAKRAKRAGASDGMVNSASSSAAPAQKKKMNFFDFADAAR